MIGFKHKSSGLCALLVGATGLFMAACQPFVKPPPAEQEPVAVPQAVAPETGAGASALEPEGGVQHEELSASLLYGVLLGEIAGQRGQLDVSGASYLQAARQSNDPRIAERALKISVYAKQPELAMQAAQRWVELAPDNLEARQALAALALRTGQQDVALEQFNYILSQDASDASDPYQSMLVLMAREPEKQGSLEVMQRLVMSRPGDADAHFAYARLAVHAENWPLAEEQVRKSLEIRPDWTKALILRAQVELKQGKGQLARDQLHAALQQNPDDVELRMAYARLLVDLEDFDGARKQYHKLARQQPDNGQVIYSLALLAMEAGQLDEARGFLEQLLTLEYQQQQAYYYLGAIAEESKDYPQAMQWYMKVEKGDHWIEVQIRMARLEAEMDDVPAARDRIRTLRLSHPAQAQRLFLVEGEILSRIESYEEAYGLYSEYLEASPDDPEILYARALVAERLDRLDDAERDFQGVLDQDPENARTLNALGYTLADRTERYQEALELIQRALAQTPDDPAVIDSMGWVLYRLGRLPESREYLQRAYDISKDGEIAAHLGEVMWMMGDRDAAGALWDKARKESPGDPVLEDAVRRFAP